MKDSYLTRVKYLFVFILLFPIGCSSSIEEKSQEEKTTSIVLSSSQTSITIGEILSFTVKSNRDEDITAKVKLFVDNKIIDNNTFIPSKDGAYSLYVKYTVDSKTIKSNTVNLTVTKDPNTNYIKIFDELVFFNQYKKNLVPTAPEGVFIASKTTFFKKITEEDISKINNELVLELEIKAACDNYDRLGSVFINFLPKGEAYDKEKVSKSLEIARFITPFMDKNKSPDRVYYSFAINNIVKLLKDVEIKKEFDFWIGYNINGTTSAGKKEIVGCTDREETFYGSLTLISPKGEYTHKNQALYTLAKKFSLKSYKENDTDVLGQTVKTFTATTTTEIKDAKLYLITSNHGANEGGEEYSRRSHNIFFNGVSLDTYIPGGLSCEPFRIVNTQGNGIYGASPRTDAQWASFSNWCPGDKIPIRVYSLGDLTAGDHFFKIDVPDAKFKDNKGSIPVSAYIQGNIE